MIDMLIFILLLLNLVAIGYRSLTRNGGNPRETSGDKPKRNPKHHSPNYYGYDGGWANVCVCNCGSVSLYEDNHPVNPCRDCGTKKERVERSARWTKSGWEFAK